MAENDEFEWSLSIASEVPLAGPREELEAAIDDILDDDGEVSGGRGGPQGWVIEIELSGDAPVPALIDELRQLLREAGVSRDTRIEVVRRQSVPVY